MESTGAAAPFDSFKSKKVLRSTVKPALPDGPSKSTEQVPWTSKTPEKPINPPRRATTRRTAMFVKEIRQEAEKLRTSSRVPVDQPDLLLSSVSHTKTLSAKSSPKKLPEKDEILDKFFNSLDSSIRLLRLKGSTSTFTNISPKIECLTDRRFSYSSLAQIKFILPEAIEIKKILTRDERTNCMKPDLHITLNADAVEGEGKMKSDTGSLYLRKVFRARLQKFCKVNPEDDDVPEGELPGPFNRSKQDSSANEMKYPSLTLVHERARDSIPEQKPMVASLLSQSFRRHFSKEVASSDAENVNQEPLKAPLLPAPEPRVDQISSQDGSCPSAAPSPIKWSPKIIEKRDIASCASIGSSWSALPETPIKNSCLEKKEDVSSMVSESIQATPAKLISTPAKLMIATPAQQSPRRCFRSPDADSVKTPNKLVRRPNRSRSLKFDTPLKIETGSSHRQSEDDDIFDILPDNLLESIKEKERKAMEEKDPAISQAKWRQQMIASLPKLYDMLLFFFQSIKRTVIIKEELVHRIISTQLEITDRREVDEQLRLLQELAPEWIYEKMGSSGDMLLCVNKISSAESIRTRIAEAQ